MSRKSEIRNQKSEMAAQAKADIRRDIRDQRLQLDPDWIRQTSDRIQERFLALEAWLAAPRICCYLAAPAEVQTRRILDACWQAHKRVWVPAFHPAHGHYECVPLAPNDALIPGPHQIPEPAKPAWQDPEAMDLVVIPGLVFDSHGGRIGHGGGHYDQLLTRAALRPALKVGLAFAFQVRESLPSSAHDVSLDLVVTETTVMRCRTEKQ